MKKGFKKDKVAREIESLKRQIDKLKKDRIKYVRIKHDLDERVKELDCLYGISKVIEKADISLEQSLQDIVELIPPSWQYPEITSARIVLDDKKFETDVFSESKWHQSANIYIYGQLRGCIDVFYLKKRPDIFEGPFLKEERHLIDGIAQQLGKLIERKIAEEELSKKNYALKEIIAQIEMEKRSVTEAVNANVNRLIVPALKKLKRKGSSMDSQYIDVLERNLADLTSSFGLKIVDHRSKLTSREIEICHLIKSGLSMKEIAKMLNISFFSVGTHRRNIRKKLGLSNQKINLPTFLKDLL